MKLNTNLLIGAALLGGGAYVAYHKGWFGFGKKLPPLDTALKANQEVLDKVAAEEAQRAAAASAAAKAATAIKQATTISNPKSYEGKVAYIQTNLGVAVDGKAGSQTNKTFAAIYGLDRGDISTANIDYYEARVKAKDTLAAKKAAAAVANAKNVAAVNVTNNAQKFLDLVNNGKYKATLTKSVTANAFVFDNLKKAFVNVNDSTSFPKNMTFGKGQFSTLPRGGYVMLKGASNKYFALNPNDFLVTL
jgi:hypothetical protein